MNHPAIAIFLEARRTGTLIADLPADAKPRDLTEAHAIQDATAAALGDDVAGWKVAAAPDGATMRGVILRSRVYTSPATIPAKLVPLLGIETEIAFRFDHDVPPRAEDYTEAEIAALATAFPAIEIVDSRFQDYRGTPSLDRTADCMSNGAFIAGPPCPEWRQTDLSQLEATLEIDDGTIVQQRGALAGGSPLRNALLLVNLMRRSTGIRAGQFVTTGTYTGLTFAKAGNRISTGFTDFGERLELVFD